MPVVIKCAVCEREMPVDQMRFVQIVNDIGGLSAETIAICSDDYLDVGGIEGIISLIQGKFVQYKRERLGINTTIRPNKRTT